MCAGLAGCEGGDDVCFVWLMLLIIVLCLASIVVVVVV